MLGDRSNLPRSLGMLALSLAFLPGCLIPSAFRSKKSPAASFMTTVEQSKDPNARYAAYDKLSHPGIYESDEQKDRAVALLTEKLSKGREPQISRALICRTLGVLGRPAARTNILAAANDEDALVRAEACRALGRVGKPEDATILCQVMQLDSTIECRVAAVESLGDLKAPDRRVNELLVQGMEDDQPAIRVASLESLRKISGSDLGVEALAWKKWVENSVPKPAQPTATAAAPSDPAISPATLPLDASLPALPPGVR